LAVADGGKIATHSEPVWRDKTNFILRAELTSHGLNGGFEQLWTRTEDRLQFELCCIPFFLYGMALDDWLTWDESTDRVEVAAASGRGTIRVAFSRQAEVDRIHSQLHGELVGAGFLIEFNSPGYGAIDLALAEQFDVAPRLLAPYVEQNVLSWEWAKGPADLYP
jgi:Domain of unknown function (DUF4265)